MVLQEKTTQASVRARLVVRQFATYLDANVYSPTPGLEFTRVLLPMALSKDLAILIGYISVAIMSTTQFSLHVRGCTVLASP